jgi:hypothetical protein
VLRRSVVAPVFAGKGAFDAANTRHCRGVVQAQAGMTMKYGVAAGNQHLEGAAHQGQDTRIPACTHHRRHTMVIRRFAQRGMVCLKCLAFETGALDNGNACLQ